MLCLILLQQSAFRLRSLQYYYRCHCGLDRCSLPVPCLLASTSWVRYAFLTTATPQHQDLRLEKFHPSTIPLTPPAHDSSSVSQFLWASHWRPCHPRRQALSDLLTFWRILQPFVTCLTSYLPQHSVTERSPSHIRPALLAPGSLRSDLDLLVEHSAPLAGSRVA